jgi:hypothetical protein
MPRGGESEHGNLGSTMSDTKQTRREPIKAEVSAESKERMERLLEDARQKVKPVILRERKAEEITEAVVSLRLK